MLGILLKIVSIEQKPLTMRIEDLQGRTSPKLPPDRLLTTAEAAGDCDGGDHRIIRYVQAACTTIA
jgi:hypothetical protein